MKRLLIGYDGSECADEALDDLRYAGLPGDLDVKLLTVPDVWLPPVSEKLGPVYPDSALFANSAAGTGAFASRVGHIYI